MVACKILENERASPSAREGVVILSAAKDLNFSASTIYFSWSICRYIFGFFSEN